ncbi:MAG: septum formation family protein [bacterium]|nr:septum formation family protein [bacterium]
MARARPSGTSAARRVGCARGLLATALVLLAVAAVAGCGEQEEAAAVEDLAPVRILRLDPGHVERAEATKRGGLPVVEETDRLEGLIVNRFELEVDQCFNSYLTALGDNQFEELTTVVDCAGPHDGEVYYQDFHPADASAAFPGDEGMLAWAQRQCYEQFEGFVGAEYELSELEIGVLHPTEETWTDPLGRHREVTCYVEAWRGGRLLGSMRGSGF